MMRRVQNAVDSPGSGNGQCDGGGGGGGGLIILDKRTVLDWKLYLVQEYCDGVSLDELRLQLVWAQVTLMARLDVALPSAD